jgi:2',3'-cyclic-nucleotide 2'-phosphodiesterase (5'-nucleotidase family)
MRLLQVSGIKYSFDVSRPTGSRIIGLTLTDGTPIANDASTTYSVTANEFLATGGDKFTAILNATNFTRTGVSDLDALIEYVQYKYGMPPANSSINPAIYPDGRITNVTP